MAKQRFLSCALLISLIAICILSYFSLQSKGGVQFAANSNEEVQVAAQSISSLTEPVTTSPSPPASHKQTVSNVGQMDRLRQQMDGLRLDMKTIREQKLAAEKDSLAQQAAAAAANESLQRMQEKYEKELVPGLEAGANRRRRGRSTWLPFLAKRAGDQPRPAVPPVLPAGGGRPIANLIPGVLTAEHARCGGAWRNNAFTTRITTQAELEDSGAKALLDPLKLEYRMHRKVWEYLFLMRILDNIPTPKTAVGFAVGQEPTVSYLASLEVNVTATDVPPSDESKRWANSNQHMTNKADINRYGIATEAQMEKHVNQEYVDMIKVEKSRVWKQQGTFDLVWSICSVEHVGSIKRALTFMDKSLQLLRRGGTLVHTTEFNIGNLEYTVDHDYDVVFRKKDIDAFLECARNKGYTVEDACYDVGTGPLDKDMDTPPYSENRHLRLQIRNRISTCVGIVVRKPLNYIDNQYNCSGLFNELGLY